MRRSSFTDVLHGGISTFPQTLLLVTSGFEDVIPTGPSNLGEVTRVSDNEGITAATTTTQPAGGLRVPLSFDLLDG